MSLAADPRRAVSRFQNMSDITIRLRRWTHAVDAVPASDLMDEAADVIDSLRAEVRTQRAEIAGLREERAMLLQADSTPGSQATPDECSKQEQRT